MGTYILKRLLAMIPTLLGVAVLIFLLLCAIFAPLICNLMGVDPLALNPDALDKETFYREWGISRENLRHARPDAIVMHPGPINRGVEIDSAVADGERSVILPQVTFGIAVRMAVMSMIAGN